MLMKPMITARAGLSGP
nr:TPA_asm: m32.5 sORF 2 [Murid betaherpesvirus 1]DBA07761.1 TPA_asm: m32.5 sORF 2 [Murid betaherpesvirus 1]